MRLLTRPRKLSAYACIAASLTLVLALGGWAAYSDLVESRAAWRRNEITRLRSHAERSAGHIESQLRNEGTRGDLAAEGHSPWLQNHWRRTMERQRERLYAAVVDVSGTVVAHSQPDREGRRLTASWFDHAMEGAGDGVHETRCTALSAGRRAIDVRVPITQAGHEIGVYHSGLDADWLDAMVADATWQRLSWWCLVIGGISVVVFFSSLSLYWITRQTARLESDLELAHARRAAEISQLAIGLAHEIRNPLNAIRLNLHTLARVYHGDAALPEDEVTTMLRESTREIERLEQLMRDVLGFGCPGQPKATAVCLAEEVQAALGFLKQKLDDAGIAIQVRVDDPDIVVRMDPARLRQVLLNLLTNACEAVPRGGRIVVDLARSRDGIELTVSDDGEGVPAEYRERVFEPFFSLKPSGTGLGLALVRRFVEEEGGQVSCEAVSAGRGGRFRVRWPRPEREEAGQ